MIFAYLKRDGFFNASSTIKKEWLGQFKGRIVGCDPAGESSNLSPSPPYKIKNGAVTQWKSSGFAHRMLQVQILPAPYEALSIKLDNQKGGVCKPRE